MKDCSIIYFLFILILNNGFQPMILADRSLVSSASDLTIIGSSNTNPHVRILSEKNRKRFVNKHKNNKAKKSRKQKEKKQKKQVRGLKIDKKSMNQLERYAISSLIGVVSAQVTANDPSFTGKARDEKVQESVQKMLASKEFSKGVKEEARTLGGYLKKNEIRVPKDIKMKEMERIMKGYIKKQYDVDGLAFDSVKPVIKKVYKAIRERGTMNEGQ